MRIVRKSCEIHVSYFCFTLIAAAFVMNIAGDFLICLLAAILHELGHIAAIVFFAKKIPERVVITPFGVNLCVDLQLKTTLVQKIIISLSGPCVNLITFIVCLVFFQGEIGKNQQYFIMENFMLFLFNLLPILPLDGGCILFELLSKKLEFSFANMISELISFLFILPIFFAGFYYLLNAPQNYFLLFIACYLMLLLLLRIKR